MDSPSVRPSRRPVSLAVASFAELGEPGNAGFSVTGDTRSLPLRGFTPDPLDSLPWQEVTGRRYDILYEGRVFPVVSNMSLEESQAATGAMLARHMATPGRVVRDDSAGRLVQHGPIGVMHRCCRNCGSPFTQWRFATQRRRWKQYCGDDCQDAGKRRYNRDRMRRIRAAC